MTDVDWDSKLVIGSKRQTPKVAKKESDLNGTCTYYTAIVFQF